MIYVLKHYSIASLLIYFCKTSYANIFFFQLFNEIFLLHSAYTNQMIIYVFQKI